MAAKELYISYGSSEIEEMEYHFLDLVQDSVNYTLMCRGNGIPGAEDLAEMAKEIIELEE